MCIVPCNFLYTIKFVVVNSTMHVHVHVHWEKYRFTTTIFFTFFIIIIKCLFFFNFALSAIDFIDKIEAIEY